MRIPVTTQTAWRPIAARKIELVIVLALLWSSGSGRVAIGQDQSSTSAQPPESSSAVATSETTPNPQTHVRREIFSRPQPADTSATVSSVRHGEVSVPVVIVRGTPYKMGFQIGRALKEQMHEFLPRAVAGVLRELDGTEEQLAEVWSRSAAFADDRVEQELAGLADGSGLPLRTLQAVHAMPLVMPYSCSSIAAWGDATEDGHLYQTRNLDWSLEIGAHEFPVIVVYIPADGTPHVLPTFAGFIGAHTGMNMRGIALAEMGDSPRREAPYNVHAPHFTVFFRTMLYDADSLDSAISIFRSQPMTKRYHFVFGDGRSAKRAVKILAHAPESPEQRVRVWTDNDPTDEFAPQVLSCVVYNDEGRGAYPTLKAGHGSLNGEKLVALANSIPIRGGNVVNVVYDATALRMWVTYAAGELEAFQRPSVMLDLAAMDLDQDGTPDLASAD